MPFLRNGGLFILYQEQSRLMLTTGLKRIANRVLSTFSTMILKFKFGIQRLVSPILNIIKPHSHVLLLHFTHSSQPSLVFINFMAAFLTTLSLFPLVADQITSGVCLLCPEVSLNSVHNDSEWL